MVRLLSAAEATQSAEQSENFTLTSMHRHLQLVLLDGLFSIRRRSSIFKRVYCRLQANKTESQSQDLNVTSSAMPNVSGGLIVTAPLTSGRAYLSPEKAPEND